MCFHWHKCIYLVSTLTSNLNMNLSNQQEPWFFYWLISLFPVLVRTFASINTHLFQKCWHELIFIFNSWFEKTLCPKHCLIIIFFPWWRQNSVYSQHYCILGSSKSSFIIWEWFVRSSWDKPPTYFFLEKFLPACRFGVLARGHERASLLSVLHVFKRRGKCHSVAVALLCKLGEHFCLPLPSIMRHVGLVRQGTR